MLAYWLGAYAWIILVESAVKIVEMKRMNIQGSQKRCLEIANWAVELSHIIWVGFSALTFNPETKTCV